MCEDYYSTQSYIVRLMFDIYNDKGAFIGCENWYLGKNRIVANVYEAQVFSSESKAITAFYQCYRPLVKDFIKNSNVDRQWDGFSHIEELYSKTIRTDQFDPFNINDVRRSY